MTCAGNCRWVMTVLDSRGCAGIERLRGFAACELSQHAAARARNVRVTGTSLFEASVSEDWPGDETHARDSTLVEDGEAVCGEQRMQSTSGGGTNWLPTHGGHRVYGGVAELGEGRYRRDDHPAVWAQGVRDFGEGTGLIWIPVKRLGARQDVDGVCSQGQLLGISLQQSCARAKTSSGLGQHACGVIDTHHIGIDEMLRQSSSQVPRTAPQVDDALRIDTVETSQHGVVYRPIGGILETRTVIGCRPAIEQR
jgi:hypothetical protein